MSIGSIQYNDYIKLNEVVNNAYENEIIIVAACSNNDVITYPASLSNVIGVKCLEDANLSKDNYIYNIYSLDGIDIMACSKHKISDSLGNVIFTEICNSFATPMITAKVCAILEYNPKVTLEEIKLKLYMNSSNYIANENGVNRYRTVDWINKYIYINKAKIF